MRFFAYILLSLLLGQTLMAEMGRDEKRDYSYAKKAFEDHIYEIADRKLTKFLQDYPQTEVKTEARWLLGQSYFFEGKYKEALDIFQKGSDLNDPLWKGNFLYWEGKALTSLEKYPEAHDRYRLFLNTYSTHPLFSESQLSLVRILYFLDKKDEYNQLLQALKANKDKDVANKAMLIEGEILLSQNQQQPAEVLFQKILDSKPSRDVFYSAQYWQGKILLAKNQVKEARIAFEKVTEDKRAYPLDLVAKAWLGLGECYLRSNEYDDAIESFERVLTITNNSNSTEPAVKLLMLSYQGSKKLSTGVIRMREFFKSNPEIKPFGMYSIGRVLYDEGNPDAAILELDRLVQEYPQNAWAWEARWVLAKALSQKQANDNALNLLNAIVNEKGVSEDLKVRAYTLRGNIEEKTGNKAQAASAYRDLANHYMDPAQAKAAYLKSLALWFEVQDLEEFNQTEKLFEQRFAKDSGRFDILFEKAKLLDRLGETAQTIEICDQILTASSDEQLLPLVLLMKGLAQFEQKDYSDATKTWQQLMNRFPKSGLLPEALFWKIEAEHLANAQEKSPDKVRQSYEEFITMFPQHQLAQRAYIKIAQLYYQQQNFAEAQVVFQKILDKYPQTSFIDQVLYFQGRCAVALENYKDAISLFEKVKNDSTFKREARLWQVRCYIQLGKIPSAMTIADSLIDDTNHDEIWVEANLRKANSLYTLAQQNPENYDQAVKCLTNVVESPESKINQLNEAGYLKGKILMTQGKKEEALESFLDVVYGRLLPSESGSPSSKPEFYWFVRSGSEAAQIKENEKDIKGAIAIYRVLEKVVTPNREEFRQKIEDLKLKNFIWEDDV